MPKITFQAQGIVVEVPEGTSILDAGKDNDVKIGDACGGNLACSTCHVYVEQGADSLDEASEMEEDILDKAFDVQEHSRLGCQCKVTDQDLVVVVSDESIRAWYDENPDERKKRAG